MNRSELQIRIDDIADEFLQRRRNGEKPKVDEFVKANPDIAEPLGDFLKMILMVDDCADQTEILSSRKPLSESSDASSFPTIPDYEIIREVGRGGMGIVYEAQQLSLDRTVALKILPESLFHHPQAIERFELEAKSAARLHHSHIVPVFDVGQQAQNRFYTMQFIEGQSLDLVIDSIRQLKEDGPGVKESAALSETVKMGLSSTTAGRKPFYRNVASLGRRVASALQYAHESGVVHRDIKPSNLMLDPNGTVWIMDFGLAKTEESDLTQTGDVVGTLRYMSPERFAGQCDLRSDIYSLGMTLYELLSQRSAFGDSNRLGLIDSIKNREPEPLRKSDRQIPRDLETIVEKAINKDPKRRYETAGEFALDLQRFTDGQPIRARKVSALERLWLWSRKHRALSASLAATAVLLVAATIGSLVAAASFKNLAEEQTRLADANLKLANENEAKSEEAESERRKAQAAASRSDKSLAIYTDSFMTTGPSAGGKAGMLATEVLANAQRLLLDSDLEDEAQIEFLNSLSNSFIDLGDYEAAVESTEQALEIHLRCDGEFDRATISARSALASTYGLAGRLEESRKLYEQTIEEIETHLGAEDPLLGSCLNNVAGLYNRLGKYDKALASYLQATDLLTGTLSKEGQVTLETNVAQCYRVLGQVDLAIETLEPIVKRAESELGEDANETLTAKYELAEALRQSGDTASSIAGFNEILPLQLERLGADHPFTLQTMRSLGTAYMETGKYELAAEKLEACLEGVRRTLGEDHPDTLDALDALGGLYLGLNDLESEHRILVELLELTRNTYGNEHQYTVATINNLATNYYKQGKLDKSIPLFEEVVPVAEKLLGQDHPNTLMMILNLGTNLQRDGKQKASISHFVTVYENSEHPQMIEMSAEGLLEAYAELDDQKTFGEFAGEWISRVEKTSGEDSELYANYCVMIGAFYNQLEQFDEAESFLLKGVAVRETETPDSWKLFAAKSELGESLIQQGKLKAAEPWVTDGYEGLKQRADSIPEYKRKATLNKASERLNALNP